MMQMYKIRNKLDNKVYIGIVYQEGKNWLDRTEEHLSLRKCSNKHLRRAIEKDGRENFEASCWGDYNDLFDLPGAETVQIFIEHSWQRSRGYNMALYDSRAYHALDQAAYSMEPEPDLNALLDAAIVDFRNNSREWRAYDTLENEAIIRQTARKEKCSVATAFRTAIEGGPLTTVRY